MRILAFLTLVITAVFVATPSLNNGLGDWFGSAPVGTKIMAGFIVCSVALILGRCVWEFRAREIPQRTWRNIAFIASTLAAGLSMIAMVLVGTLTPVPGWMLSVFSSLC